MNVVLALLVTQEHQSVAVLRPAAPPISSPVPTAQELDRLRAEVIAAVHNFVEGYEKLSRTNDPKMIGGLYTPDVNLTEVAKTARENQRNNRYEEAERLATRIKVVKLSRNFARITARGIIRNIAIKDTRTRREVEWPMDLADNFELDLLRIEGRWLAHSSSYAW